MVPRLVPALLLALEQELAPARLSESLLWDVPLDDVLDPRGMRWSFTPPAKGMLADAGGIELKSATGQRFELGEMVPPGVRCERALYPIVPDGPWLALRDSNPLSMLEEHPDKSGNAVDLAGHPPAAWCEALARALDLLALALPDLHHEITRAVERVVPVGYHAERHFSASYREAPGLVYLSLHPSALTLAEALIHEHQHGKLNTLRWFDPLLHNAESTWTSSPIRPDLRPLLGVLMAVHAFVPVSALHLRLAELGHPEAAGERFGARRAEVLAANADGLATLEAMAQPTRVGGRVLEALRELDRAASRAPSAPAPIRGSVAALA
jgi:HEXXH motif-containing protein